MIYLDTSALLRVLFDEAGPRAPLGKGMVAASSRLLEIEGLRAIERARLDSRLSDLEAATKTREIEQMFSMLHLLPIDEAVLARARLSFGVRVRALDAIHVATAQVLIAEAGPLELWTHDPRQAVAALSRALEVRGVDVSLPA